MYKKKDNIIGNDPKAELWNAVAGYPDRNPALLSRIAQVWLMESGAV
jgi:hypothetical protein